MSGRANRLAALVTFAALVLAASCSVADQQDDPRALGEPIVVHGAQFRPGPLPGQLPVDGAAGSSDGAAGAPLTAEVLTVETLDAVVTPGQVGKRFAGLVTDRAFTVAARLTGLGSGYWTFPVGVADPQTPGAHTWEATADFAASLPAGLHPLRLVALDDQGVPGRQRDLRLCVSDPLTGLRACGVDAPLPAAAIVLTWSDDVDLDLHVRTPAGQDVSPGHPTDGDAVMSRDSNANCVIDGARREQLVWASYPTPGRYQLRANLASACGLPSVTFRMAVYVAQGTGDAAQLVSRFERGGVLSAATDETPSGTGLLVTDFDF